MENSLLPGFIISGAIFLLADLLLFYAARKKFFGAGSIVSRWWQHFLATNPLRALKSRLPVKKPGAGATASLAVLQQPSLQDKIEEPEINQQMQEENMSTPVVEPVNPEPSQPPANAGQTVHVVVSADVPTGMTVHVTLRVEEDGAASGEYTLQKNMTVMGSALARREQPAATGSAPKTVQPTRPPVWSGVGSKLRLIWQKLMARMDAPKFFLLAAALVYAGVIFYKIDRFPIYFFTDEAIHMNLAADFLRDGFKNYFGEPFPTFFTTEGWVNGISVYVQVIPYMIFGKSVVVTRLVSAIISLFGALAVSLMLKDTLKIRHPWLGILFVVTTPAWFLHARTAFEYVEVASFYSLFLYFYSRYREGLDNKSLYWAILFGYLAFYTHGLGQVIVGTTGLILLVVDFRFHFQPERRKTLFLAAALTVLLFLPFARYYLAHPAEAVEQVKRRGSYWSDPNLITQEKFEQFFSQYFYGLSPQYWYMKNSVDLNRHIMNGYGNGLLVTLPFLLVGLYQIIRNFRKPAYRLALIALLVCPVPASIVAVGMPRMLWMTIPTAMIGAIGLSAVLVWLEKRLAKVAHFVAPVAFVLLTGLAGYMLTDALINGPLWFPDYSLYGMQYGAQQVFGDVVRPGLVKNPEQVYVISPSWANGTEKFKDFFIPEKDAARVRLGQPVDIIDQLRDDASRFTFVSTATEYNALVNNPEFTDISVKKKLKYPDGNPGFYVLTLKPSPKIDEIIAEKHKENITPIEEPATLPDGTNLRVLHSPLGAGSLPDVFDDNSDTLVRVLEANPFLFDITLEKAIHANAVEIQTGALAKFTVSLAVYATDNVVPVTYTKTYLNLPADPVVSIPLNDGPQTFSRIVIQIKDENSGETSQIHVRTIQFK